MIETKTGETINKKRWKRSMKQSLMQGIGMAKFNKGYYEGYMPKVGCPGCNNYTMECVK